MAQAASDLLKAQHSAIIHQIEAETARKPRKHLTVAMAAEVALYILNHKRNMIVDLETRYDMHILLEQDNSLFPPDIRFDGISEKTEQQDRKKPKPEPKNDTAQNNQSHATASHPADSDDDEESKPKRRRRRGKRGGRRRNRRDDDMTETSVEENSEGIAGKADNDGADSATEPPADAGSDKPEHIDASDENKAKPSKTRRSRGRKPATAKSDSDQSSDTDASPDTSTTEASETDHKGDEKPAKKSTSRRKSSSRTKAADTADDTVADSGSETPDAEKEAKPAPKRGRRKKADTAKDDHPDKNTEETAKPKRAPRKRKLPLIATQPRQQHPKPLRVKDVSK